MNKINNQRPKYWKKDYILNKLDKSTMIHDKMVYIKLNITVTNIYLNR